MSVTIHPAGHRVDFESQEIPWVNWANDNAAPILAALDLDDDHGWGELAASAVMRTIAATDRLLTGVSESMLVRMPMVRADKHTGRFIVCGTDDAAIVRRLEDLRRVLAFALARGIGVVWS